MNSMSPDFPPVRGRKKRILIVDDSAAVRQALSSIIESDPALEVMGVAADPYVAAQRIRDEVPDAIILDIEMPRMDGLTFLRKLMAQRPIPVVICSTLTEDGSSAMVAALEAGAVDVITKPRVDTAHALHEATLRICDVARAAAHARPARARAAARPVKVEAKLSADVMLPPAMRAAARRGASGPLVCIGASTGGTEALREVLMALPAQCPATVIVQHMPEKFTAAFAGRLNGICAPHIKEAADGDAVVPGQVLIAPGDRHLLLERLGSGYRVRIKEGPRVSRHRPSVDVLFRSAAQAAGASALGILMTGMGDDGAHGLLEMRNAGALTIAQDEASCVVFGMPKAAIDLGGAARVTALHRIAREVMDFAARSSLETQ